MANVRPTRARFVGIEPMVNAIHKWEEGQMAAEGIKPEHIDDLMSAEALTVVHNRATWGFRRRFNARAMQVLVQDSAQLHV